MATIASTNSRQVGVFTPTTTTLTSSDVLPYDSAKTQLLVLSNQTAGSITATIDGADGTSVTVDGLGSVSVASGLAITIPQNEIRMVRLQSIRNYLQGVVAVTGGTGLRAQLLEL